MQRTGFTLIKLLVVVGVIALLTAILLPVFARAHRHAKVSVDISNLRQLGHAASLYAGDHNDRFVPSAGYLVDTGYCPVDVVFSPLDMTDSGLANLYGKANKLASGGEFEEWPSKVSYVGLFEWASSDYMKSEQHHFRFVRESTDNDGWLISQSGGDIEIRETTHQSETASIPFHSGHYLRLTMAGGVIHRQMKYKMEDEGPSGFGRKVPQSSYWTDRRREQ